ncbi:Quercetin 2,3-dioxygenase [Stieleria maiorica]|uniref:Quercetin 2,3-dioxygenase n=2 Tax=Stieleria maiorica TaxID=2795974 RepID=A0A5B9M9N0_9BACT|nr:Quercetin 2,3-dioxygenase [Stieleria maiorica]
MIKIRSADERGHADHGWLKTYHTFSFTSYRDREQMGFRSLRVMNEDRVAAGKGFGTHQHDNMEIVSYVLEGAIEHKDSMGNGEVLKPGEFQRISAGTGISHSEFNPSSSEPMHFYQIWLIPSERDLEPSYEQKTFEKSQRLNELQLVASPDGQSDSLTIHTDAKIYLLDLDGTQAVKMPLANQRHGWVQVLRGSVELNGASLGTSDGAAISDEDSIELSTDGTAELMLFDLA